MSQQATKLVIITEKVLFKHVVKIIDAAGAAGYTVTAAQGKGSRSTSPLGHPSVSEAFVNIKLEILTTDEAVAREIADRVSSKYFENFSGLIYLDTVEVLYAHRL